jgi:hypothetical protein
VTPSPSPVFCLSGLGCIPDRSFAQAPGFPFDGPGDRAAQSHTSVIHAFLSVAFCCVTFCSVCGPTVQNKVFNRSTVMLTVARFNVRPFEQHSVLHSFSLHYQTSVRSCKRLSLTYLLVLSEPMVCDLWLKTSSRIASHEEKVKEPAARALASLLPIRSCSSSPLS